MSNLLKNQIDQKLKFQALSNKLFSYKELLRIALVIFLCISILCIIFLPENNFNNFYFFLIQTILTIFLYKILDVEKSFSLNSTLVLCLVMFVFPRISYLLCSSSSTELFMGIQLSRSQILSAFSHFTVGTLFLSLGFYVASLVKIPLIGNRKFKPVDFSIGSLLVIFIINACSEIFISNFLGNNVYSNAGYGAGHKLVSLFAVLLNTDIAFLALLFYAIKDEKIKKKKFFFVFIFFLFTLVNVIFGSRKAGVVIIEFFAISTLAISNNFIVKAKNVALFFLILIPISLFSFAVGTAVRNTLSDNTNKTQFTNLVTVDSPSIFKRLNAFDSILMTISLPYNEKIKEQYMNVPYALKVAVNTIVPGKIFENSDTNTALIWPFMFEKRDISYLNKTGYYESFYWTAWGLANAISFKYIDWFVLFVMGLTLHLVYLFLAENVKVFQIISVWFLFNVIHFFLNMGLDHWLVVMQKTLVSLVVTLFLHHILTYLKNKSLKNLKFKI